MAGQLPYPLTTAGKEDADLIASELGKAVQIDKIISSPLKRAEQTAESFGRAYDIDIKFDKRITEQNIGRFSGMAYDMVKLETDYVQDPLNRWDWIPAGGGESYKIIARRITDFLTDITINYSNLNILIVTHAVALRLIIGALKNTLPEYPKDFPNNGEILRVEFEGLGIVHEIESILLGNSSRFTHNA